MMYRLQSHIDESLNREFECFEDMLAFVKEHSISDDDATMEEWIDDRINPELSGYRVME